VNQGDLANKKPMHRSLEWLWVAGLLVVAFCLRVVFLRYVPPGVRFDELVNVKIADHIYAGEWPIYFQEAWGHEPLYHYFHAAGMLLLGKTVLGVRITSICFGTLGVLTAYLIFRQLFGKGVGWIAAALLATSFWSLLYSRIGLRHIGLPPWVGMAALCFWRALNVPVDRRARMMLWFSLGGVCTGLLLHTYFASRVVPAIWAAFIIYLAIFHREMLKGRWLGVLVFVLLPALMVIPMWQYLRQHPELENRLGQVSGELFTALRAGNPIPMLESILNTLKMFSLRGDPEWLYNISGRPVFTPPTALLFYAGLLISLWRWKDPKRAFVLLWLGLGIAPTMFSWPSGSLGHSIVAQPVTFVFPAMTLQAMWQWSKENITPNASQQARWATRGLMIVLILSAIVRNGYDYFLRWPHFPEVQHEYQAPITAVARYLETHRVTGAVCVSAPYVDYWNPWSQMEFELFYQDPSTQMRWFDGTQSILFPQAPEAWFFLPDHNWPRSSIRCFAPGLSQ
jgi:4-amino-4-deoxy-L-arabinose transferase-like glycosyltransferase